MKIAVFLISAFLGFSPTVFADVAVDAVAPDFTLQGHNGKPYKLSDFKGKTVVLEWFNNECPYVEKHYGSQNMQNLQKQYTKKGVVWLTISTGKKGKQGHLNEESAKKVLAERKAQPTALLLDTNGDTGRKYGAKTTPHMYVISPEGKLVYQGAIDDKPSSRKSTIKEANNYVVAALDAVLADQPVKVKTSEPYGCSVKY